MKNKGAIIFSLAVGAFVVYANVTNTKPQAAVQGETVQIISGMDSQVVPVATTKEAEDEFSKVLNTKDQHGYDQMFSDGRMFRVAAGTRALVIDRSYTLAQVRLLEGRHEGKAGWVPVEFAAKEHSEK